MVKGKGTITLRMSREEGHILHELLNHYVDLDEPKDFFDNEDKEEAQAVLENVLFALEP